MMSFRNVLVAWAWGDGMIWPEFLDALSMIWK